jgi:hypothetical protein
MGGVDVSAYGPSSPAVSGLMPADSCCGLNCWLLAKPKTTLTKLVTEDRGYLILFMFSDPAEGENAHKATNEISSLRFFGETD